MNSNKHFSSLHEDTNVNCWHLKRENKWLLNVTMLVLMLLGTFSLQSQCNDFTSGGFISGDQTICAGEAAATITNIIAPSGGSGNAEYLWLSSTTSCTVPASEPILGANGISYNPGVLNQTTYFRRCSRRAGCSQWIKEANCVTITVLSSTNPACNVSINPCDNDGGDSDDDGICNNEDCQPFNPNFPATPGTSCNDGDVSTENDVIQAGGCECAGTAIALPTITIDDITVNEGAGTANLNICLNQPTFQNVTVQYSTANGTALVGADYNSINGTATIFAGQSCTTVTTSINEDQIDEPNETFVMNLSAAQNATIADPQGTVTILDNDEPAVSPCDDVAIFIGQGSVTVTGLTTPITMVQIFDLDNGWVQAFNCTGNCDAPTQVVTGLSGNYLVKATLLDASWTAICVVEENVSVTGGDPCANAGGDSDNDGICNANDCQPFNSSFPATPNTPCDDGNANTTNDVITADGCACAGTPDGGGNGDCDDVAITTGAGSITIDGLDAAPITMVQIFDLNNGWATVLNCAGNCNTPTEFVENLTAGNYLVKVTLLDAAWNSICIIEETISVIGGGEPVCDNVTSGGQTTGNQTICSGENVTISNITEPSGGSGEIEYIWLSSTTSCPGSITQAIAGTNSISYNTGTLTQTTYFRRCSRRVGCTQWIGEASCVTVTVLPANDAACQGDPCVNAGGDTDGDGVCNADDCQPNNPNFPATAGTPCNDGNPNTDNDTVTTNGCGCEGTPINTGDLCNNLAITLGTGSITVSGLDAAPIAMVQIFDLSNGWQQAFNCSGDCDAPTQVVTGLSGNYLVKVTLLDAAWSAICAVEETVTVTGGNNNPCDNAGGDSDNDGICDVSDCQPFNPNFPATPNTPCDDGNANTTNDVITAGGCACEGTPIDTSSPCDDVTITIGVGSITVDGLDSAPVTMIQIFDLDNGWQTVLNCAGNCNALTEVVTGLSGNYYVKVTLLDASWGAICVIEENVSVTGGDPCANAGGDSDNDGICNANDCQPFNPNFPATPYTPCDDGNANTTNDVVTADGCACAGVIIDPCANAGGDSDNDGICNANDCQPFNPNFPATPYTPCDDGNANTNNDVVTADGCGCEGTIPSLCQLYPNATNIYHVTDSDPSCSVFDNSGAGVVFQRNSTNSSYTVWQAQEDLLFIEFNNNTARLVGSVRRATDGTIGQLDINYYDYVASGTSAWTAECYINGLGNYSNYHYSGTLSTSEDTYTLGILSQNNYANIGFGTNNDDASYGIGSWPRGTIGNQTELFAKFELIEDCEAVSGNNCDLDVLFVVGDIPLNSGDNIIKNRLESKGYNVTLVEDAWAEAADANGQDLVLISSTVASYNIGTMFTNVATPVVTWEAFLYDDLNMVANSSSHYGSASGVTQGTVANSNHPIMAGVGNGTITINNQAGMVSWGTTYGSNDLLFIPNQPTQCLVIAFESGTALANNTTAAARRVGLFLQNETAAYLTATGWKIFDQSIYWATNCTPTTNNVAQTGNYLTFQAKQIEQDVNLYWANNTGESNDYFTVERSEDGITYEPILERASATDNDARAYEAVDTDPNIGENYYRLKLTLRDGSFQYSTIRKVIFNDLPNYGIYPNPATNMVRLNLEEVAGSSVQVQIFDQLGRKVQEFAIEEATVTPATLDVTKFQNGAYLLYIKAEGQAPVTKSLVIMRD